MQLKYIIPIVVFIELYYICGVIIGVIDLTDPNITNYNGSFSQSKNVTNVIYPKEFIKAGVGLDAIAIFVSSCFLLFLLNLLRLSKDFNYDHDSECSLVSWGVAGFVATLRGLVFFILSLVDNSENHTRYGIYALLLGSATILACAIAIIVCICFLIYMLIKSCIDCASSEFRVATRHNEVVSKV